MNLRFCVPLRFTTAPATAPPFASVIRPATVPSAADGAPVQFGRIVQLAPLLPPSVPLKTVMGADPAWLDTVTSINTNVPPPLHEFPGEGDVIDMASASPQVPPPPLNVIVPLLATPPELVRSPVPKLRQLPLGPTVIAPLVRLLAFPWCSVPAVIVNGWVEPRIRLLSSVTVPPVLLMVHVPLGFTPPLFVNVWSAEPENATLALPPSKVEAIETGPRASIVPVPTLLLIRPLVRVKVPATMMLLVLLNKSALSLVLFTCTLFRVNEAGTAIVF